MSDQRLYLDREQCARFNVSYFEAGSTVLAVDQILASKRDGYDEHHRNMLEPIRVCMVTLDRKAGDDPGWFAWKVL